MKILSMHTTEFSYLITSNEIMHAIFENLVYNLYVYTYSATIPLASEMIMVLPL